MSADSESWEVRPFLKIRRAYLHNFEASRPAAATLARLARRDV
jgi:hypothetical protein